jgi:hypothetical protein
VIEEQNGGLDCEIRILSSCLPASEWSHLKVSRESREFRFRGRRHTVTTNQDVLVEELTEKAFILYYKARAFDTLDE